MKNYLQLVSALIKYKVSIAVTFTAITGYIVYAGRFNLETLYLVLGVFFLAGGSSALNECQESEYDARMERTKNRPIPTGQISRKNAWLVASAFVIVGLFILYVAFGVVTALLGVVNLVWYNLIYTYLKRVTPFAVVPGSLVGAIPALMGWTAAGGYVFETTIIFIAFFLFIWQIPHFWLLMIKYGKEYESAGFSSISKMLNEHQIKLVVFVWGVITSLFLMLFPLFSFNLKPVLLVSLVAMNFLFISLFYRFLFMERSPQTIRKAFILINTYAMVVFLFLVINAFIS